MKKSINYQDYLIASLKDPIEAANYLNAALEGGDTKVFLLALSNVAKAQGGVSELANKSHKSRTSLYKTLSLTGNPYLKNTNEILSVMGMHFVIAPTRKNTDH
jgi:probable addiction module antidote protein